MIKEIDIREDYEEETSEEKQAYLSSRQPIINDFKKWPTELWMKVIQKAIEDAAFAQSLRNNGEQISEEIKEWEESALSFLFDDNHRIPFDDYMVEISCPRCGFTWTNYMSTASAETSICTECKYKINSKYIEYRIKSEQAIKEISLAELISLWGVENISMFRDGCKKRINELSQKKRQKISNWRTNK